MRLAVCGRTRLILVLHSFLSGVARAARRHAPLFTINEGEDGGNGQWGERQRADGTHAQLRKKKRTKKAGQRRRRGLLEGEDKRGERDRMRGGREGGEKGVEIQRERERGNSNLVSRGSNTTIAGRSSRRRGGRGGYCGSGLGVCYSIAGGGRSSGKQKRALRAVLAAGFGVCKGVACNGGSG